MKANYSLPVGKNPVVKIKYAPQVEMMAVEPAQSTSSTVEVAHDWTPLLLLLILVSVGIIGGQWLRSRVRRHSPHNKAGSFGAEATTHNI